MFLYLIIYYYNNMCLNNNERHNTRFTINWKIDPNDESMKRMQKQMSEYINNEIIKQYFDTCK